MNIFSLWKQLYNVFCGSEETKTKSQKLTQMMMRSSGFSRSWRLHIYNWGRVLQTIYRVWKVWAFRMWGGPKKRDYWDILWKKSVDSVFTRHRVQSQKPAWPRWADKTSSSCSEAFWICLLQLNDGLGDCSLMFFVVAVRSSVFILVIQRQILSSHGL